MLIYFKPWHLDMMRLSDGLKDLLGKYPSARTLEALASRGLAYTSVADDADGSVRILGVVGATPVRTAEVAEVFVVVSEDRHRHSVAFVKDVRQILDRARGRFAIIEAIAAEGVPNRWFEWLGFRFNPATERWQMEGRV